MLLLLSPAKTLDYSEPATALHDQPRLLSDSQPLIDLLKDKSEPELMKLMKISEDLATINRERYQDFETPFDLNNAKQSILAFKGDVYVGLGAEDFSEEDLQFAQEQIRILSGLYGVLRPLDLMQPYRLEMGTRLQNERGKNLYEYWGARITELLNADLSADGQDKSVVNLASKEYFSAVKPKELQGKLYQIDFKEHRDGKYKIIAFYAKKARGMMARYAVKNRITSPEGLKAFDVDGYTFNESLSEAQHFIFTRES
ncbi:MAG: peroxide stress protein YaaA [Phaeodactylibacter sp.]|uniref:peroxide stress protein YaaA n=1 Tax=Phaeodactylibacter sp. TaxID=1940289 RepID=UPI0032EBD119